jgi:hypothetical protein
MAKALDGTALYTYFRRFGFPRETQDLLIHIRSSPPSRTPGARRGNMPVWYPSPKMHCISKAESAKVEFPFLLQAEHDDDVLEMWDQPPSIPLEYFDSDLQAASELPADLINIAIARHDLYVDLATYRLSEPWRTPAFRSKPQARAALPASVQNNTESDSPSEVIAPPSITPEGQDLLDQAREVDMMAAIFRNRVINPDHFHDDEQAQVTARAENIPARTIRRWRMF